MNRRKIRWIIALMSVALLGIISLQVYWILHDIRLKEQQFEQSVNQAMNAIVDRIETGEAMSMLHEQIFTIDPVQISRMMLNDSSDVNDQAGEGQVKDTIIEVPGRVIHLHPPVWEDLDQADINIEFHNPATNKTFLRVQKRNSFHQDSISRHTIHSSQITRIYGDSAEVTIKQNEEKIKAKIEKLNSVMQKMAIEFAGPENDVSRRLNAIQIDSLIRSEFQNRNIGMDYNYGVWNGNTNKFVISRTGSDPGELIHSKFRTLLFPNDIISKPDYLLMSFPNSIRYLLASMWLMLACSTLFTLTILFGFAYTIMVIIRQKKLSDIKTDFINNMTHEFKTPIATISLAVDSINNPKVAHDPSKLEYFSRIIREENKRMNAQVEHVLQMAQIEKGDLNLRNEPMNIHELIHTAVDLISLQVESKGGTLKTNLLAENPVVSGDPVHLSNVLFNLFDNANKYSPLNPEILISTQNNRDGILVSVKDKGMGMTQDTQKKIFDKFYRVPTGNLHDIKGFGLGLSYVKVIIEKHKGWISVISEPGKGSTFEFFIPFTHL